MGLGLIAAKQHSHKHVDTIYNHTVNINTQYYCNGGKTREMQWTRPVYLSVLKLEESF